MSYPINQKFNPTIQPTMGINGINNAPLQNVDTEKIVNNSPVTKATKHDNPGLLIGLMVPTGAALAWFMNKFSHANKGEYKDSAVGKIGAFGDKIGSKKVFNNSFTKGIQTNYSKFKTFLNDKVIAKNKILNAFFNTRSKPTNHMVLTMSNGIESEISSSVVQLFEKYTDNGQNIERVKKLFPQFVENGNVNIEKYQDLVKNSHKHAEEIRQACLNVKDESFKLEKGGKLPIPKWISKKEIYLSEKLPFTKKLFCKETYFSEFANKLTAAKGAKGTAHATALGKALPRQTLRVIEGFTNATTGGGIIGVLMGSYIIADAITKAIKAPKGNGEKRKTFAENMIYNLGFYLTMPFALKIMHSFGGLQYIGMSKEKVEEYRKNLAEFNAKAQAGEFTDAEYKAGKKQLLDALKGDTKILKTDSAGTKALKFVKNLIHRPLKRGGSIMTAGLESINANIPKNATTQQKFFRNLRTNMKNWCFGGPLRFGLFLFAIAPPLAKLSAKASHMVFGKPTKSVLDEGKEEKEIKEAPPIRPTMPQQLGQPQAIASTMQPLQSQASSAFNQIQAGPRANLIDMYKANQTNQKVMSSPKEPVRTYIPSSDGVVIQPNAEEDKKDRKIEAMLNKSYNAEKAATKFIH